VPSGTPCGKTARLQPEIASAFDRHDKSVS